MGKTISAVKGLQRKQQRCDVNLLRVATIAANGEAIVIGSNTFSCVTTPTTAFQFAPGADAAGSITNIVAVINSANTQNLTALALTGVGVLVVSDQPGARGLACTETLAGANNAWASATMYGGIGPDPQGDIRAFDVANLSAKALEVTTERIPVCFGFTPAAWSITVRTSAGVSKAWDGEAALNGTDSRILVLNAAGTTDIAATDTIVILAVE